MIGKMVGAAVGRRLAKNQSPLVGALIGAATPWLLRRAFTPVGIAVAGAFAAKKLYDKKQERDRAKVRLDNVLQSDTVGDAKVSSTMPSTTAPATSEAAQARP